MVHIAYEPIGGTYSGYWEAAPDGRSEIVGTPQDRDAMVVVVWARERSDRISIRAPDGKHYWAGDGPVPPHHEGEWTADLAKSLGNPIERIRPEDADRSWILRCEDCGWCAHGDTEAAGKAAFRAHWSAEHTRP